MFGTAVSFEEEFDSVLDSVHYNYQRVLAEIDADWDARRPPVYRLNRKLIRMDEDSVRDGFFINESIAIINGGPMLMNDFNAVPPYFRDRLTFVKLLQSRILVRKLLISDYIYSLITYHCLEMTQKNYVQWLTTCTINSQAIMVFMKKWYENKFECECIKNETFYQIGGVNQCATCAEMIRKMDGHLFLESFSTSIVQWTLMAIKGRHKLDITH